MKKTKREPSIIHLEEKFMLAAMELRRLMPHGEFDHTYIKDEQKCPTCKAKKKFDKLAKQIGLRRDYGGETS